MSSARLSNIREALEVAQFQSIMLSRDEPDAASMTVAVRRALAEVDLFHARHPRKPRNPPLAFVPLAKEIPR